MQDARQARKIVEELVGLEELKNMALRLRQRLVVASQRDPEAVAEVDAMDAEYARRKPLAWAAARDFLRDPRIEWPERTVNIQNPERIAAMRLETRGEDGELRMSKVYQIKE